MENPVLKYFEIEKEQVFVFLISICFKIHFKHLGVEDRVRPSCKGSCLMYKKILVPIDGSGKSLLAACHGAELASNFGASVTLIHVIPVLPLDVRGMVINQFRAEAKELLKKVARDLDRFNVSIDIKVKTGKTAESICIIARKHKYDLIVIGSRGLSEVKGYLLGSVSNAVTIHAPCPVLIIR